MRQYILVVMALLAGFVGGAISTRVLERHEGTVPADVVRATRFELVNKAGEVVSMWGVDHGKQVVLAFRNPEADEGSSGRSSTPDVLDQIDNQRAAIGLLGDGSPFVKLRGKGGSPRARLFLNHFDKPTLLMDDEHGVRLALGVEQSDTPDVTDNDWALDFSPDRARIGMITEHIKGGTYEQGFLSVHKDRVKFPK